MNQDQSEPESTIKSVGADEDARSIIELIQSWLGDESGYDKWAWPIIVRDIEENRLSYRRRFGATDATD